MSDRMTSPFTEEFTELIARKSGEPPEDLILASDHLDERDELRPTGLGTITFAATVPTFWSREWPCADLRPGDEVSATFDDNGDLIDMDPLDGDNELLAVVASYGTTTLED